MPDNATAKNGTKRSPAKSGPVKSRGQADVGIGNNPTPEERAEFIMARLEQFIRDGRTISEGMNLRQWQDMAKVEIANAIVETQIDAHDDDVVTKRVLFTFGASFTTIGFWGGLWAYDQLHYIGAAFLCGAAGLFMIGVALDWQFRSFWKRRQLGVRQKSLRRVQDLTRRIKKMEAELEKEEKRLEKELKARGKTAPAKTPARTMAQAGPATPHGSPFGAPPLREKESATKTAAANLRAALEANSKQAG